jgi:hypothetical protein
MLATCDTTTNTYFSGGEGEGFMRRLRFRYLYRDASNYKNWGEVVFANPDGLPARAAERILRRNLLGEGLFIAHQVRIPEVFLKDRYPVSDDDHCFHEFHSIDLTCEPTTDKFHRSIADFIKEVKEQARYGWGTFDPLAPC